MWQRFTERARRVVYYAQEEAKMLEDGWVSPEHLLLGMLREPDSLCGKIILAAGVSLGQLREAILPQLSTGQGTALDMQLTPGAKRVIDLSYDEAKNLNNNYIGTEHLLLALLRMEDTIAGKTLLESGLTYETILDAIKQLQDGGKISPKDSPASTLVDALRQVQQQAADAAGSTLEAGKGFPAQIQEIIQRLREQAMGGRAETQAAAIETTGEAATQLGPPFTGDLGLLQSARGHSNVEVLLDEKALEAYLLSMAARDTHGYEQLLTSAKMLATPAGTEVKALVPGYVSSPLVKRGDATNIPEKGVFHLIRLLSGPFVGQKGYVDISNFQYVGPDERPFPPE